MIVMSRFPVLAGIINHVVLEPDTLSSIGR
jgi:hypothetical protein